MALIVQKYGGTSMGSPERSCSNWAELPTRKMDAPAPGRG